MITVIVHFTASKMIVYGELLVNIAENQRSYLSMPSNAFHGNKMKRIILINLVLNQIDLINIHLMQNSTPRPRRYHINCHCTRGVRSKYKNIQLDTYTQWTGTIMLNKAITVWVATILRAPINSMNVCVYMF